MSKSKHQVLARRYRPQTFTDVVGQEAIVTTLKNALRLEKLAHAYLFCGSRGVGKTTLARLFAKALNCAKKDLTISADPCNQCSSCLEISAGQSLDVIEIDGASNRGIDDIRQINETVAYAPTQGRFKIYIIDEVHMLTKEAFNALLKTLEEPPERVKFFFATTEPHKVLPTIISRCQRFDLGRISPSQIIQKLEQIAVDLNRNVEPGAFHLIASFSDGSLRDAESLFDQILCFAEGTITTHEIRNILGLISQDHFFSLDRAFSENNVAYAFELVESLFTSGKDFGHFYEQLIEHIRLITLAKTRGEKGLELPQDIAFQYLESARLYTSSQCLYLLNYLLKSEQSIQKSICPRVSLEAALIHYIQSKNRIPVELLVKKLIELEQIIKNKDVAEPISSPLTPTPSAISIPTHKPEHTDKKEVLQKPEVPDTNEAIPLKIEPSKTESIQEEIKTTPTQTKPSEIETITQTPTINIANKSPVTTVKKPSTEATPVITAKNPEPLRHPSYYDTLIRFAAVELEGTVKNK